MTDTRRIFFLTGARSEYDIVVPVIKAVNKTPGLKAEVVVGAAHLSPFHGMAVRAVEEDGFAIAGRVLSLLSAESWEGRGLSFANLLEGLTRLLASNRPDILFVTGDREEALAGALAGSFLRIHTAHLHGGDRMIVADLDEVLRPAISKLAHLHFAATETHLERLIRMGEYPHLVWNTGAPGLDCLKDEPDLSDEELSEEFGVDVSDGFFVVIFHPCSTINPQDSGTEMRNVLEATLSFGIPVFCSYPNTDPGNIGVRKAIDECKRETDRLIVYHNLPRSRFVAILRRCSAMVGNSSSLIIESGFLKIPGILVGERQDLRERGPNVVRVGASVDEIKAACSDALYNESFRQVVRTCPSVYGDGNSGPRIARILAEIELTPGLLLKAMAY